MRRVPDWVAAVPLVVALALVLVLPVGAWPLAYVSVRGDSMEPTVSPGDVVVLLAGTGYRVGDIVAYRVPEMGDAVILHRIIDRIDEIDERARPPVVTTHYVLRGDNNTFVDRHRPTDAEILGRSAMMVPQPWAGALVSPTSRTVAIGLLVLAAGAALRRRRRRRRRRRDRLRTGPGRGQLSGVTVTSPLP